MFNKSKFYIANLILIVLLGIIQSCSRPDETSQEYERWTSSDPLAIPLRVRDQKIKSGNLVFNPSFEQGKIKYLDSLIYTTNLEGWSLQGNNVQWIHETIDSLPIDSSQVFSGIGSIAIYRANAGETEESGEGVLSDYIKVIPGNYNLSMRLNLKDVINPKSRLGVRLYDAVDIKVICYDKNKIKIKDEYESPYYNTTINNSSKGLSLANLLRTDSTGWLHIIGKSHSFPFPDGDLQDETKFVRIFIGLKGNGSMWVDDVNFNYTKWNFSMHERLIPYLDTTLAKSNLIIPQPKKVEIMESLIYYRPYYEDKFPLILIPKNCDGLTRKAAGQMESKIKRLLIEHTDLKVEDIPSLVRTDIDKDELSTSVIFSLGKTQLAKDNLKDLPILKIEEHEKGFIIHSLSDQNNLVILYGNSSVGNFYAVQVALQLFDEKRLLFHNANVVDYPTRDDYALLILDYSKEAQELLLTSTQIRFSELYLPGDNNALNHSQLKDSYSISIYYPWSSTSTSKSILASHRALMLENKQIQGLAVINANLTEQLSISEIALKSQNIQSNETSLSDYEVRRFLRYGQEQDVNIELMPKYSNNLSLTSALNDPAELSYILGDKFEYQSIWSGNHFQTWRIDEADLLFYSKTFTSPSIFLDLTLFPRSKRFDFFATDSIRPHKLRTACLFEPYSNEIVSEVYETVDKTILGFEIKTVFDRIRLQTASDYFWNPSAYNPDLSVYRALVTEFGEQTAKNIIQFNDLYFRLKSELILASELKNVAKHQRKITSYYRDLELVQKKILSADEDVKYVELNNIVGLLIKELKKKVDEVILISE